jgi:hypothetical protein
MVVQNESNESEPIVIERNNTSSSPDPFFFFLGA